MQQTLPNFAIYCQGIKEVAILMFRIYTIETAGMFSDKEPERNEIENYGATLRETGSLLKMKEGCFVNLFRFIRIRL